MINTVSWFNSLGPNFESISWLRSSRMKTWKRMAKPLLLVSLASTILFLVALQFHANLDELLRLDSGGERITMPREPRDETTNKLVKIGSDFKPNNQNEDDDQENGMKVLGTTRTLSTSIHLKGSTDLGKNTNEKRVTGSKNYLPTIESDESGTGTTIVDEEKDLFDEMIDLKKRNSINGNVGNGPSTAANDLLSHRGGQIEKNEELLSLEKRTPDGPGGPLSLLYGIQEELSAAMDYVIGKNIAKTDLAQQQQYPVEGISTKMEANGKSLEKNAQSNDTFLQMNSGHLLIEKRSPSTSTTAASIITDSDATRTSHLLVKNSNDPLNIVKGTIQQVMTNVGQGFQQIQKHIGIANANGVAEELHLSTAEHQRQRVRAVTKSRSQEKSEKVMDAMTIFNHIGGRRRRRRSAALGPVDWVITRHLYEV